MQLTPDTSPELTQISIVESGYVHLDRLFGMISRAARIPSPFGIVGEPLPAENPSHVCVASRLLRDVSLECV
eukprot:5323602-Pyramimonas_sp.AAC.1